jgi:hypothetical protein
MTMTYVCPSCEGMHIRSVTGEETKKLQALLEQEKITLRVMEEQIV